MLATVLLVDDEELFRTSAAQVIERRVLGARVVLAADGLEAMERLVAQPFDLVITDLRMPRMDGFALLSWMVSRRLHIPVIVTTSFATAEALQQAKLVGALEVLDKPVDFDRLLQLVRGLVDEQPRSTEIVGVTLAGFTQLLAIEQHTCWLEVGSRGRAGVLKFRDGELIDAITGKLVGIDAAIEILSWDSPHLVMSAPKSAPTRTIDEGLNFLLLEASRIADEAAHSRSSARMAAAVELDGDRSLSPMPAPVVEAPLLSPEVTPPVGGVTTESKHHPKERIVNMANVKDTLDELMKLDGIIATALADWQSGLTIGTAGTGKFNVDLAAAGNCNVLKAKMSVMESLGISGSIQDILITLEDQIHILRPLKKYPQFFIYVALDKAKGNMGLARLKIQALETSLSL